MLFRIHSRRDHGSSQWSLIWPNDPLVKTLVSHVNIKWVQKYLFWCLRESFWKWKILDWTLVKLLLWHEFFQSIHYVISTCLYHVINSTCCSKVPVYHQYYKLKTNVLAKNVTNIIVVQTTNCLMTIIIVV